MAVLVFDGFDRYAAPQDLQSRVGALQWNDLQGTTVSFEPGRGGFGQCITAETNGGTLGCSFGSNLQGGTFGLALRVLPPTTVAYIDVQAQDYNGLVSQVTVRLMLNSGTVYVYSGDPASPPATLLAISPPNAFNPYNWNYIEISTALTTTSVQVEVHVNGATVIPQTTSTTSQYVPPPPPALQFPIFNGIRVRPATEETFVSSITYQADDLYIADRTTGPGTYACNGFLGDVAVRTLRTTGNSSVQWTPLNGTNWGEVNEEAFDGDVSYNFATAVGAQDLFTFQSLPTTTATVFGVQVTGAYRKLDASEQTISQDIVSGGTAASAPIAALGLSYAYYTSLFTLDPHTNATWTPAAVDSLIAGYTLTG